MTKIELFSMFIMKIFSFHLVKLLMTLYDSSITYKLLSFRIAIVSNTER